MYIKASKIIETYFARTNPALNTTTHTKVTLASRGFHATKLFSLFTEEFIFYIV